MTYSKLHKFGWSNYFFQQLSYEEVCSDTASENIFRISAIYRNRIEAMGIDGEESIICPPEFQPVSQFLAVGDWVLAARAEEHFRIVRILEPKNRVRRVSNGCPQVIAANLDYLWIVTSANDEFNVKRLGRYLAMAYEFDISPVVILTKTDVCDDVEAYARKIAGLGIANVHAVSVNYPDTLEPLAAYLTESMSIALMGSSGVGKSTLINAICKTEQLTREIRAADSHGKHATTHRQLFFCDNGVAVIDTPGMRELQLLDAEQGVERVFHSIAELIQHCKYGNCSHVNEPGCAVQEAIENESIAQSHFDNYQKLIKEDKAQKRRAVGAHAVKEHDRAYFKKVYSGRKDQW